MLFPSMVMLGDCLLLLSPLAPTGKQALCLNLLQDEL